MRSVMVGCVAILALTSGCVSPTIRAAKTMATKPPRSIVVMPCEKGPGPQDAAQMVVSLTITGLQRQGYDARPATPEVIAAKDPATAAGAAGADAVIYPRITLWNFAAGALDSQTSAGVGYSMYAVDGTELWVAEWKEVSQTGGNAAAMGHDNGLLGLAVGLAVDAANTAEVKKAPPYDAVLAGAVQTTIADIPDGPLGD